MKEIQLNNNKITLVDDDDFDYLNQFKWHVYADGYVRTKNSILMHRLIMGLPYKMDIDHINHDKSDNRKSNLRQCNRSQNMANSIDDGYKGVEWDKHAHKWKATIGYNYKRIHLGLFNDREEAKRIYDAKAEELFGEFHGAIYTSSR